MTGFSSNTFCTLAWSQLQINTSGNYKVCCFTGDPMVGDHGMGYDKDGTVSNVLTHSFEQGMNTSIHKDIRIHQLLDKRHPACAMCWSKDDANVESHRVRNNREANYIQIEDAASLMEADGSINNTPVYLDLRFGNLCNAKCIMCEPLYSSLWYEDVEEIYGTTEFSVGREKYNVYKENGVYKSTLEKWWESDKFWNDFERISPKLTKLYITGGEPMLVPKHAEMLDMLISNGNASNIELSYDTNLLAINEKIISKFKHFKNVDIAVSSDDIEERYHYIRYPSNWNKLQNNIQLMKKYNIKIKQISLCIGIYSVYSLMRMVPFYNELGFYDFRQRILKQPVLFDIKWLPRQAKLDIISAYSNSNIGRNNWQLIVGYLYNNLNTLENPIMLKAFVDRMDKFDKIRGLNWKNTFPEVADILKDYIT